MQNILNRLAEFINLKKWNKAEFARKMSIKPQHVNKYLDGDLDIQNLFINLYNNGCDINWLIGGGVCNNNCYNEEELLSEINKLKISYELMLDMNVDLKTKLKLYENTNLSPKKALSAPMKKTKFVNDG